MGKGVFLCIWRHTFFKFNSTWIQSFYQSPESDDYLKLQPLCSEQFVANDKIEKTLSFYIEKENEVERLMREELT